MARRILSGTNFLKIVIASVCMLAFGWMQAPVAVAQHGGGHFGGGGHFAGGGHFGGGTHVSAPHAAAPRSSRAPMGRTRFLSGPPPAGVGAPGFSFRRRPIHPHPILPIFPVRVLFGAPFFGFWPGYGFNTYWWPSCDPYWGWGLGCNTYPYSYFGYGYGGGYGFEDYVAPLEYEAPQYAYGAGGRELPQLYLKDGTVYDVTDYWLVDGHVHFTMLEEGGTRSVEHVIRFDELDEQKTMEVNTRRGFHFVWRDEPTEQYLQHHPDGARAPEPPPAKTPPPKN